MLIEVDGIDREMRCGTIVAIAPFATLHPFCGLGYESLVSVVLCVVALGK